MRFNKRLAGVSGAINFPVIPAILVLCLVLLVLGRQAWENTSFVSGFKILPEDVASTSAKALPTDDMNFTLNLTPAGSVRLSDWVATHPGEEVPVVFGGTYLGQVALKSGMDTHTLHMTVKRDAALAVRYQLQR